MSNEENNEQLTSLYTEAKLLRETLLTINTIVSTISNISNKITQLSIISKYDKKE